jgi:hypothetical protein
MILTLARKPVTQSITTNVLVWATGCLNIDAGRILIGGDDNIYAKNPHTIGGVIGSYGIYSTGKAGLYKVPKGRWPANVILSDDPHIESRFEDFGETYSTPHGGNKERLDTYKMGWNFLKMPGGFGDAGSVSRYFKRVNK